MRRTAPSVKRKLSTLDEFHVLAGWLFTPMEMDTADWASITEDVRHSIQVIGAGLGRLEIVEPFTIDTVKEVLQDQLHILGEDARGFLEPQRAAITGKKVSTGIYESLVLLGKDEALRRYRATLARLAEVWVA